MILVPTLLWAISNPITLGYLATGITVGTKIAVGVGVGVFIAHHIGF